MARSARIPVALAAIVLALALPAGSAQGKAPPRGKYDCTISGFLFGVLTIKGNNEYTHRGTKGTFRAGVRRLRFPDGIVAWRISFKRGTLRGMNGRWHRTSDGVDEIALKNPRDNFESIYCDRR
jgi:hypothetical protein